MFSVKCIQGCECEGVDKLTTWHNSPSSVYRIIYFAVSQHKHCLLKITSLKESETGEHKIKIDTLMVGSGVSADWVEHMNKYSG